MQEASNVLDFLVEVDEFPGLYTGPILRNAIRRYEVFWLPLAAKQGKESRDLAAPLDIAWVWHVHMLAAYSYEQDCLNIVSHVIDHTPMSRYQRQEGLQKARYIWEACYPEEAFEVDLSQPTPVFMPYKMKIQHDLEKACYHHSTFYYQVSLPHYADRKFLAKAVERYEFHLELKSRNPHIPMVLCCDVDLVRRSHKQHPLNYKRVTTEMFGSIGQRDDTEASASLGSTLDYLETSTHAMWKEAGLQYDQPGTMYRGELPPYRPPRPDWLYAPLARFEYVLNILRVEVLNADVTKTFYARVFDPNGSLIRTYTKHGPRSMDHPRGPGPWTTLWTMDLVHGPPHGPGPWTTLVDLVHEPPLGLILIMHVHAQYMLVPQCGGFRAENNSRTLDIGRPQFANVR